MSNDFLKDIIKKSGDNFSFKDYLKKFNAATVKEIIKKKKNQFGLHINREQEEKLIMEGIDPTDEILGVKIFKGTPKIHLTQDGRRVLHLNFSIGERYNPYSNKQRVEELMKGAIYQTRDKMIIMQKIRKDFREKSLYKMGFLTSKLDHLSKIFYKVGRGAYRACSEAHFENFDKHIGLHVVSSDERLIGIYLDIVLLSELYLRNIRDYEKIFKNGTIDDDSAFEFDDSRDETPATLPDVTYSAQNQMP